MTPLTQFVFFLSTAEEEAGHFNGQERSIEQQDLRYTRDLRPGTYTVQGDELRPVETPTDPEAESPVSGTADPSSWCSGRVDI